MNNISKVLPVYYFKDSTNYNKLVRALLEQMTLQEIGDRDLHDALTITMAVLYSRDAMGCLHIPHLHQITDEDARSLRNMIRIDEHGNLKSKSRNYDLLQYLSLCLKYWDKDYLEYVKDWCHRQESCLDEKEEML